MNATIIRLLIVLALTAWGRLASSANADTIAEAAGRTLYTCGMHPQVIMDHPGNCPICGMKLTPIHNAATAAGHAAGDSAISVDAATAQNMNLRTAVVIAGPLRKTIRTLGTIDYNETALADVTTKFKGWIEKLNVDATGQLVHRGEPMFEIYSPELYSAEAEFLLARNAGDTNDPGAMELRQTAENKLKFFDVFDAQIADLGIVWVIAQIYEPDLPFIQLGQEAVVKVASLPDREFRGRVTFIYPTVDEKTRTARVRLEFENPGYFLKPGMFASAQLRAELGDHAVLAPDAAILRSGAKNTVFVALAGGKFEARDVTLGVEAEDGMIQIISGLRAGERIVTSGQFLLDSESQLTEAINKMRGATPAQDLATAAASPTNATTAADLALPPASEPAVYVCPMPEHVAIVYDHAGNCPICGMALVPVTASALKKIQPGGKVLYYTCPMPEHANVHEEQPGKCPLCGMTLIPVMSQPELLPSAVNAPPARKYYCPMHPGVIFDEPGKCPKCGMDLVPMTP